MLRLLIASRLTLLSGTLFCLIMLSGCSGYCERLEASGISDMAGSFDDPIVVGDSTVLSLIYFGDRDEVEYSWSVTDGAASLIGESTDTVEVIPQAPGEVTVAGVVYIPDVGCELVHIYTFTAIPADSSEE